MKQLFLKLAMPAFRWFSGLARLDRWLAAGTFGTAVTGGLALMLYAFVLATPAAACESGGGGDDWWGGWWGGDSGWNWSSNWNSNSNYNANS